jgi:hypothetical protein
LEASLKIPKNLGDKFKYAIDRCINFPPANASEDEVVRAHTQAIAVFVKTLRIGLTFAKNLLALESEGKGAVTLCCSRPPSDLRLVASPIPTGLGTKAGELTVSQGELYDYVGLDEDIRLTEWISSVPCIRALVFGESQSKMSDCLVKISCLTVHDALVQQKDNWTALERLSADTPKLSILKKRMAVALLACIRVSNVCLMTVMKYLPQPPPEDISCRCTGFPTEYDRWLAFRELTQEVLIPLADVGIIHCDIRFDPNSGNICNVVSYEHTVQDAGPRCRKLMVIDFESLIEYISATNETVEEYCAISPKEVEGKGGRSTYAFLFWQVLWVAYGWWSQMEKVKLATSNAFLIDFFSPEGPPLTTFTEMLGANDVNDLESCWERVLSGNGAMNDEINTTLNILLKCFPKAHSTTSGKS